MQIHSSMSVYDTNRAGSPRLQRSPGRAEGALRDWQAGKPPKAGKRSMAGSRNQSQADVFNPSCTKKTREGQSDGTRRSWRHQLSHV